MMILRYYISGTRCNSTIHKLIVIRIFLDYFFNIACKS